MKKISKHLNDKKGGRWPRRKNINLISAACAKFNKKFFKTTKICISTDREMYNNSQPPKIIFPIFVSDMCDQRWTTV